MSKSTQEKIEERFNELWSNGISKWLTENGWTKKEDEV